jgi:hypothetical protein
MQHQEVIKLVKDFFEGKRVFILPSSASQDYQTFSDWVIGVQRHEEMSEILCLLREYAVRRESEMKNEESDNGQNLTQEEKSEIIQSWFDKYDIKKIEVKGSNKVFYLEE